MKDCECLNALDDSDGVPVNVYMGNQGFGISCAVPESEDSQVHLLKSYVLDGVFVSPEKYKKCFDELWKRLEGGGSTVSAILSFIACILAEEDQEEPAPPTPPPAPGYTPGSWRRC